MTARDRARRTAAEGSKHEKKPPRSVEAERKISRAHRRAEVERRIKVLGLGSDLAWWEIVEGIFDYIDGGPLRSTAATAAPPAPSVIVAAAARVAGIAVGGAGGIERGRSRRAAAARQVAMYLIRKHCALSFPEIARMFGKDHSTVQHACAVADRDTARTVELRMLLPVHS